MRVSLHLWRARTATVVSAANSSRIPSCTLSTTQLRDFFLFTDPPGRNKKRRNRHRCSFVIGSSQWESSIQQSVTATAPLAAQVDRAAGWMPVAFLRKQRHLFLGSSILPAGWSLDGRFTGFRKAKRCWVRGKDVLIGKCAPVGTLMEVASLQNR